MKKTIKLYKMDGLISKYKTWQKAFKAIQFGSHYNYDGELVEKFYINDKYFYYTPYCNFLTSVDEDLLDDLINYYQEREYIIEIHKEIIKDKK